MQEGNSILHYEILEKLGEVRLRQGFVAQGGTNSAKALMVRPVLRGIIKST